MKLKNYVNVFNKVSGSFLLAFSLHFNGYSQQIQSLSALNTPYDEQHPVFSPTGEIFYSIGFHPENAGGAIDFGDIWMSKKNEKDEWKKPVRVADLSSSGNDVVIGFLDALTILVYHEGNGKKQGIHQYSRFGNSWNYLRPLEMGNFRNNAKHFSGRLNPEGNVLVLSMTSYGSFGGEDLYVSFKQSEGKWSSPLNLGPQINTNSQELTPFLSQDSRTLYFSSKAQGKNHGRNIFYSHRIGESWDKWTTPQPIDYANSMGSELSYLQMVTDDKMAVFTSTQNSAGFGDLMVVNFESFDSPEEEVLLADQVGENENPPLQKPETGIPPNPVSANTDPLPQQVSVKEETIDELNNIVESKEESRSGKTEAEGTESNAALYSIIDVLDFYTKEGVSYQIMVLNTRGLKRQILNQAELVGLLDEPGWSNVLITSKGYLPQDIELTAWKELSESNQPLLMKPAQAGMSIVLDNIQFNRGTSEFADSRSIRILDNLSDFLKENSEIRIRLEGHTDNAGDPILNKELSLNRASKIRGYLTINGVDFERVRIAGWGGTRPVSGNDSEEGRNLNRRVELYIER